MTTDHDTPRIYVASLSDYNAGTLHGVWIDCDETTTADDLADAATAMLAESPEARSFPQGGPAEEYAIHDYEGFGGYALSEFDSFETVATIAAGIAQHGPAFAAYLADGFDADEFEEAYQGEYDSEREYAEQLADDMGYEAPDTWPGSYIDWDAATRDLFMGDCFALTAPGGVYVFRSL